ncbi:MAG: hypothetical protein AB1429_12165 [Pseudomonadota bacterium]|jgi:hypothetical protein
MPYTIQQQLDLTTARFDWKGNSLLVAIPIQNDMALAIGLVVTSWSLLEQTIDNFLKMIRWAPHAAALDTRAC